MAHTPGPWRAAFTPDYYPKDSEDRTSLACVEHDIFDAIDIFCPERTTLEYEEHEANARLIAAAPDLLAACEAAYEMFGDGGDPRKVIKQVEAAIAKAKATP